MSPLKSKFMTFVAIASAIPGSIAIADEKVPQFEYRCVIGRPSNLSGRLSSYKSVTLKPGESVVKIELGDDQDKIDELSGVKELYSNAQNDNSKQKVERLKKRVKLDQYAKDSIKAKRVLIMRRGSGLSTSLDGLTSDDEAANSWEFKWNSKIPYSKASEIRVILGTEYSGPNFAGFKRLGGLSFHGGFDTFVSTDFNQDGRPSEGFFDDLHLTCTRMDAKFTEPREQSSQINSTPVRDSKALDATNSTSIEVDAGSNTQVISAE